MKHKSLKMGEAGASESRSSHRTRGSESGIIDSIVHVIINVAVYS
jgi:hypothetical protein